MYILGFRQDIVYGMTQIFYNNRQSMPVKELSPDPSQLSLLSLDQVKASGNLLLIDGQHAVPERQMPLCNYKETSLMMQEETAQALSQLLQAAQEATGEKVFVSSAYRTAREQEDLRLKDPKLAAQAGYSEHQTGLALDLYTQGKAQRNFVDSKAGAWIQENAQDYGFIIRYPFLSRHITGVPYEPWHLRYVGKPHSLILYHNGMTLEQYLEDLKPDRFYQFGPYVVSRQKAYEKHLTTLSHLQNVTVSADNTGYYVICGQMAEAA